MVPLFDFNQSLNNLHILPPLLYEEVEAAFCSNFKVQNVITGNFGEVIFNFD